MSFTKYLQPVNSGRLKLFEALNSCRIFWAVNYSCLWWLRNEAGLCLHWQTLPYYL